MRVLFWTYSFWPAIGGLEFFSARLLPALRERGYEFAVVTSQRSPDQSAKAQYKGIPVYRFPFRDVSSYTNLDQLGKIKQRVAQLKRTFAPDLVHMNYGVDVSNFFYLTTMNTSPAFLLVTVHGKWSKRSSLEEGILRAADWVVGVSTAALEEECGMVPNITSHSSIIYNGWEPPPILPTSLPIDAPRLLCVGRLSPEKRIDVAVAAFASVVERFPRARLIIAGEGPARADLEQQVSQLNLAHAVDFMGRVPPETVPTLINASTLVIMASQSEGLPLVSLETAFMARPLVATRVGGLPEVVVHKETGFLVEPEDPKGLAEAVALLLADPHLATHMGKAARRRAVEKFSWNHHVDAYDTLYQRVVTDQRRRLSTLR